MKTLLQPQRERAVALIIVLAMLVLLSGLVVSFMTTVGNERAATIVSNNEVTTRQIADSTVNLVISQIREATSQSGLDATVPTTWSSQPGAIRTLSGSVGAQKTVSNGASGVKQWTYQPGTNDYIFKLYSAEKMKITTGELGGSAWDKKETDVIEKWDRTLPESVREETKNLFGYVDLNEPIVTPMPESLTGGDARIVEPRYPIVDPRAKSSETEAPNKTANPGIVDGFDMKTTGMDDPNLKFIPKDATGIRTAGKTEKVSYLPMPVKWLYVMRDGSMAAADDGGKIVGATADNPIVGRTAFWTDDDSCRLNINTASEGTFWDTPSISAEQESGNVDGSKILISSQTSLSLGSAQPVRGEYQRYAGHPATTCLSPVFGWLWGTGYRPADYPPKPPRDAKLIEMKDAIAQLAPFSPFGRKAIKYTPEPVPPFPPFLQSTSMAGSYNADADVIDPKVDPLLVVATKRLYATVDELVFRQDRVTANEKQPTNLSSPKISPEALEKLRFFLTANSRSPELNLFGRPRVTFWPINVKEDQRTSYDDLFAFTSTLHKDPNGIRENDNTFFMTRYDAKNRTNDFSKPLPGNKNSKLFSYLQLVTGDGASFSKIPGFGGSFQAKYTAPERDQILTEIFDYCRSMNLVDTSKRSRAGDFNPYTPFYGGNKSGVYGGQADRSNDWSGQVTPLRTSVPDGKDGTQGLGRFPTVSEVAIVFHRSSLNPATGKSVAIPKDTGAFQATLILEMATVMPGFPALRQTCWTRVTVDRATTVTVTGNPVPLDINLVGQPGQSRINIINVPSHDATNGRGFMPTLGFLNQMNYFTEPSGPTDIADPAAPKPNLGVKAAAKKWQWVDSSLADVTMSTSPTKTNYKRTVTSTLYPYCSQIFMLPDTAAKKAQMTFTGGAYTIEIFAGEAPDDGRNSGFINGEAGPIPVHTIHVSFPDTAVTCPAPTSVDSTFSNRITAQLDDNWNIFKGDDVIRSVEFVGPANGSLNQQGDLRLGQARREVPATWFTARLPGTGAGKYGSSALQIHGITTGHGDPLTGFTPDAGNGRGRLAFDGTNRDSKPAILPALINGVQNSAGGPGDWDRGLSKHMDGAYGNKVDEGNIGFEYGNGSTTGNKVPYWLGRGIEETGHSFFSPNRQISSAIMFGSLPTGAVRGKPWQTLLFRPDRGSVSHPGAQTSSYPADHLLLDLFNLPIVEPYAISEAFSSAGKVNLNYVIAPFGYAAGESGSRTNYNGGISNKMGRSYLRRDTALRGVFKSVKMMAIPTKMAQAGHDEGPTNTSGTYRFDIDAEKTLDQFEDRLKDPARGLFRSATEICDMDLYPLSTSTGPIAATDWGTFWDTTYALTGDNQRERPYSHIYPRVTTKSNIYTVYMRCQAVKKVAGTAVDKFDPKKDKVIGSYRGSATIERFVDPNDPELAKFDATSATSSVDKYYRFRVLATKQFLPR